VSSFIFPKVVTLFCDLEVHSMAWLCKGTLLYIQNEFTKRNL
jgi:hypothetical protein